MIAGWINLIVVIGVILIAAAAVMIVHTVATRPKGRPSGKLAKPSKAQLRKVNPKTGDLFR